jgi:hypothetical protein
VATKTIDTREVRKALREVRRLNRMVDGFLNSRDLTSAYAAAEQMQHAAFEAKRILSSGGTYEPTDG